jgi:enhancing lycopene biosynthesis protein 2
MSNLLENQIYTAKVLDAINTAWNEAEEMHSGLNEMTNEEIIECKDALIERANIIMRELYPYATSENEEGE